MGPTVPVKGQSSAELVTVPHSPQTGKTESLTVSLQVERLRITVVVAYHIFAHTYLSLCTPVQLVSP